MFGFQRGQHGVKKLQVAVILRAGPGLPACPPAFCLGELAGGGKALRKHQKRLRPLGGKSPCPGGVFRSASMAVPAENHRHFPVDQFWDPEEGGTLCTLDGPGAFDKAFGHCPVKVSDKQEKQAEKEALHVRRI